MRHGEHRCESAIAYSDFFALAPIRPRQAPVITIAYGRLRAFLR